MGVKKSAKRIDFFTPLTRSFHLVITEFSMRSLVTFEYGGIPRVRDLKRSEVTYSWNANMFKSNKAACCKLGLVRLAMRP